MSANETNETTVVVEGKVLTPKGYKKCPACKSLVKGPRTKTCPECKTDFPLKGKAVKATKGKMAGKVGRPRKTVGVVVSGPVTVPDPYTFNEVVAMGSVSGVKRHSTRKNVSPVFYPQSQAFRETLMYLEGISVPEPGGAENVKFYA